jgi:hypothetical protein
VGGLADLPGFTFSLSDSHGREAVDGGAQWDARVLSGEDGAVEEFIITIVTTLTFAIARGCGQHHLSMARVSPSHYS